MTSVSKNIKRLRNEAGMSQETLAEKLSVTRQTVSSWETGRTQPDLETLAAIGEALGSDVTELIYGKKPPEVGGWKRYQKKYVAAAVILMALAAALALYGALRIPALKAQISTYYILTTEFLSYRIIGVPLEMAAFGALTLCLVSFWGDIRIKIRWVRIALLCVSALAIAVPCSVVFLCVTGAWQHTLYRSMYNIVGLYYPFFILPGMGMFLGLNK